MICDSISGEDLRKLRLLKGIKQDTIAKMLRITQQAYSKKEKKKVLTEKEIEQILSALECRPFELDFIKKYQN